MKTFRFKPSLVIMGFLLASTFTAQAQDTDNIGSILVDKGTTTAADLKAWLKLQPRRAILNYVSNRAKEKRIFEGSFTGLTSADRFALVSDDGSTVQILSSTGSELSKPVNLDGKNQDIEGADGIDKTFVEFGYDFQPNLTYKIKVTYTNTIHSSPQDLDGIALFKFRQRQTPTTDYTPKLDATEINRKSALLFWERLPAEYGFRSYKLYTSANGQYPANATPIATFNDVNQTSYPLSGLTSATDYHTAWPSIIRWEPSTKPEPTTILSKLLKTNTK